MDFFDGNGGLSTYHHRHARWRMMFTSTASSPRASCRSRMTLGTTVNPARISFFPHFSSFCRSCSPAGLFATFIRGRPPFARLTMRARGAQYELLERSPPGTTALGATDGAASHPRAGAPSKIGRRGRQTDVVEKDAKIGRRGRQTDVVEKDASRGRRPGGVHAPGGPALSYECRRTAPRPDRKSVV